jgi:pyruvate formate lyase activating enzyme
MANPFIRQARLQGSAVDTGADNAARCLTCERRCLIAEGERGWCGTRENRDGAIYTLIYGAVSSLSCNPIEKKPLYHFYPGSVALTAGFWSCNFDCPWCQNWHISKKSPAGGEFITPQAFIEQAQEQGCQGTSISFNEPTLSLEWSLDVFPLAYEAGLYNTFVTNGYMTETALDLLIEAGLDGMNVDLKGSPEAVRRYCKADVDRVWRNCRLARERGIWIEITTLVIPGVNDEEGMLRMIAERIVAELGAATPWHVTRYYPAYRFDAPPTPVAKLEWARKIGIEAGLDYVYVGNVRSHPSEQTYCPGCGARLVERKLLAPISCKITPDGCCPRCGQEIAGAGWSWRV